MYTISLNVQNYPQTKACRRVLRLITLEVHISIQIIHGNSFFQIVTSTTSNN